MHMHSRQDTTITCWVYSKQHRLGQPHNAKFPNVLAETTNVVFCFFSAMPASVRLYSLDCCNLNLFFMIFVIIWDRVLPAYQWALEVDFPHMRKAILGVSLTCAPMEVLFRQLVLIPLSLQAPVGQTGRRKHWSPISLQLEQPQGHNEEEGHCNHSGAWGTGVRGSQKREVGSPRPHILENFSPSHGVCSFCGFMQTGLQSQTVWSSPETWVLG